MTPSFVVTRNLEQFEDEFAAGHWKAAGYEDLISERKFLVYRLKSDKLNHIDTSAIEYRCTAAHAICPTACPEVVELAHQNTRLEILTSHFTRVSTDLADDDAANLFLELIKTLAVLEAYDFFAPGITVDTLGIDEAGALTILPSAYALPLEDLDASIASPSVRHLYALADIADDIASSASAPSAGSFIDRLASASQKIGLGNIVNLNELSEHLFQRSLDSDTLPFHPAPSVRTENNSHGMDDIVALIQRRRLITLQGSGCSGKTSTLRTMYKQWRGAGHAGMWLDEWSAGTRGRRRSARGEAEESVWFVDDLESKPTLYAQLLSRVSGNDVAPTIVYSSNPTLASEAATGFQSQLHNRLGDEVEVIAINGSGDDAAREYLTRLAANLTMDEIVETELDGLAQKIHASLEAEERQVLELLAIAGCPLPFEIIDSAFAKSRGDLHRRIQRLSGLDLLEIQYRRLPPTQKLAATLQLASNTLQIVLYDAIPVRRRTNLHRTIARLAERRGDFPSLFVFRHLIAGDEREAAAHYGAKFLRKASDEERVIFLDTSMEEMIDGKLIEHLSYGEQMFTMFRIGKDLFDRGRREEAEELLNRARDIDASDEEIHEHAALVVESMCVLADMWASRGNYTEALDLLSDTKDDLNPHLSLADQAQLLNEIGWLQYRLGDYENSVESCKLSLNTLNPKDHPIVVAQALNLMGVIHYNTSRYDEAISYYEQSAFLREREGDQPALAGSYNNMALAYQAKAEYDKALNYYSKSLQIKKAQNQEAAIAAGCLNEALLYLEVHNFDEAEKRCRESLKISEELGISQLMAENHSTLGDIALTRGEFEKAEAAYHKSLALARRLETINEEMGAQRRLAKLYLELSRYAEAREAIDHAARLGHQIGSKYENAQIENTLGDLNAAEEKYPEAIAHHETAASGYATVSKYRLAAAALAKVGISHSESGNTFDAKHNLDRALDLIKSEIGHEIPDEIITLQQMLREQPIKSGLAGTDSQKLLYAFYELSSLADYADDKASFFARIIGVFQDLTGATNCHLALQVEAGQFSTISESGETQPLIDPGIRQLFNRALQLGTLLHTHSSEIEDIAAQIPRISGKDIPANSIPENGNPANGNEFVCVPMKSMGRNLGCVLLHLPTDTLPLSKEDANFIASVGRHVAGALRLTFYLEEHAHKEETLEKEFESLKEQVVNQYHFKNLIGKDETMRKVFRILDKVKDMDTGILIIGESGTGKTELARTLHYNGPRRKKAFQQIHCAEIPISLLESELFGHEKGAFTGAVQRKLGRCEVADGGTIFLDDVNVMPMETQAKLLHYLESKSFTRLGGTKKITTDVRIIAASNEDLEQLVKEGRFREDLFYRLKVIVVDLPPLRDRRDDMIAIAQAFLKRRCEAQNKPLKTLSSETIKLFVRHQWPGNVRELQNILEQVVLLTDDDIIEPSSLPEEFLRKTTGTGNRRMQTLEALVQQIVESDDYSDANPLMPQIEALLASKMTGHIDSKGRAATLLGITRPTLYNRLRNYSKLR